MLISFHIFTAISNPGLGPVQTFFSPGLDLVWYIQAILPQVEV